jgi:hypothetical protein
MRSIGKKGVAGIVAGTAVAVMLGLGGVAAASSGGRQAVRNHQEPQAPPQITASSPPEVQFRFTITRLPASQTVGVTEAITGGEPPVETVADATTGGIRVMETLQDGFVIISTGGSVLDGTVEVTYGAVPGTYSGSILFPAGTSVTLTNLATGRTVTLSSGPFSIPTGVNSLGQVVPVTG